MLARHRPLVVVLSLLALALGWSGCTASTTTIGAERLAAAAEEPVELSNEDVYRSTQNSVVFVHSPADGVWGSGIVLEGGWILTNAHVVDRGEMMRIGRSDGVDLGMHPVYALDWIFDLALVGPLTDAELVPIQRTSSADVVLGERVLLVGFPDEDSAAPTPTLTEGIVSRRRTMALGDYQFLQVDATIAPGQSGGALVNSRGELIGISGLQFGQGEFGLVFSSDAMWPRVDLMIEQADRGLPTGPGELELSGEVGPLRNYGFTVEVDASGPLEIEVTGIDDIWIDVQSLVGVTVNLTDSIVDPFRNDAVENRRLYIDELANGRENLSAMLEPGTYQVLVGSLGPESTSVGITSSHEMRQFPDVEELQPLPVGEIVEGQADWARDVDQWQLPLEAGQDVSIRVDGIADTLVVVRLDDTVVAWSDDEGIGIFGTGAELGFTAEESGEYIVEIGSYDNDRWGYLVEVTLN